MASDENDADRYDGPRAHITEVDGVVSASVEETNRLRTLLGLKPLRLGPSKETRVTVVDVSQRLADKPTASEVKRRVEVSRAKRHREELTGGLSVAEELASGQQEEEDSVQWVERMRKRKRTTARQQDETKGLPNDHRKKAQTTTSQKVPVRDAYSSEEEAEYAPPDTLKVDAQAMKLRVGQEVILTLKDRNLIDAEGELDTTEDLLEDPDSVAQAKREKLKTERNKKTVYNPFDEDADEGGTTLKAKPRDVLPHYDDWAVEAKMVRQPKGADIAGAISLKELTAAGDKEPIRDGVLSLASAVGIQKDFMTPEEAEVARKKAVARLKNEKKVGQAKKKKQRLEEDDQEEDEKSSLLERLNPQVNRLTKPGDYMEDGPEDLDDAALYEQLAKRRKLVMAQQVDQVKEERSVLDAVSLLKRMEEEAVIKEEEAAAAALVTSGIQSVGFVDVKPEDFVSIPTNSSSSNALEFTSTTEFCRALETPLEKMLNIKTEDAEKQLKSKRGIPAAAASLGSGKGWRGESVGRVDSAMMGEGGEEGEVTVSETPVEEKVEHLTADEERAVEFLVSENLLDGGIASALNMLKSRGELSDDSWRLGRHSRDNRPLHQSTSPTDTIKIEYKDEFGRVLGPKDAFRYISWAFHGKGPGKQKREKLLRKIETEKKKKDAAQNTNLLPTMQALRKQQKHGQAHVVLSSSSRSSSSTSARP